MRSHRDILLWGGFFVLLLTVLAGVVLLTLIDENLIIFEGPLGYLTIALFGAVSSASIVVQPFSAIPVAVNVADQNFMPLVILVWAVSAALGESSAYYFGRIIGHIRGLQRVQRFLSRRMNGRKTIWVVLFLMAAIPVPVLFDLTGVIAGDIRYPWRWFIAATALGRMLKYWAFIEGWGWIEKLLIHAPLIQSPVAAQAVMIGIFMAGGIGFFLAGRFANGAKDSFGAQGGDS